MWNTALLPRGCVGLLDSADGGVQLSAPHVAGGCVTAVARPTEAIYSMKSGREIKKSASEMFSECVAAAEPEASLPVQQSDSRHEASC